MKEGYQLVAHRSVFVRFPLQGPAGREPARLDDDAVDADEQRRRRRQSGADLPQGASSRTRSTTSRKGAFKLNRMERGDDEEPKLQARRSAATGSTACRSSRRSSRSSRRRPARTASRSSARSRARTWSAGQYDGPFDELPAQQHAVRLSRRDRRGRRSKQKLGARASRPRTSTASSPGTTSARPKAPASSTSPPVAARIDFQLGKEQRPAAGRAARRRRRLPRRASARSTGKTAVDPATADCDPREPARRRACCSRPSSTPHSYPHCWRCKTELLFRLVDEWFINMKWRDEIMDVVEQVDVPARVDQRPGPRARLAQEHGRLDDLEEALLGPGAADLGGREDRRLRGHRQSRGAEGARRRGLGRVRRPHAAPAVDRPGQDPQSEDRQPDVAHPRRRQPLARRRHRALLDDEVQHATAPTGRSGSRPTSSPRASPASSATGSTPSWR